MDATVEREVLGLMGERIDVSARVLGHDDDARRAGARLRRTPCVMTVEEVVEAWLMRGVRGRARVAKLLEVEDARLRDRFEEVGDQSL